MNNLVKLPNGNWVNPSHVTAIELVNRGEKCEQTIVWCKMDAGYGTGRIFERAGDCRDELAALINK